MLIIVFFANTLNLIHKNIFVQLILITYTIVTIRTVKIFSNQNAYTEAYYTLTRYIDTLF